MGGLAWGRALTLAGGLALLAAAPASAETASFSYTGGEQTFTVPSGVSSVHVVAVGGKGGGSGAGTSGGFGAVAGAGVTVSPGQILYVEVGGNGAINTGSGAAGGFNGGGAGGFSFGGGGGGASDVRTTARAAAGSLNTRLIVAGAGGGRGNATVGGSAGAKGGDCSSGGVSATGGEPGTLDGPGAGGSTASGQNGLPGTQGQGGSGGTGGGGGGGAGLFGGGGGAYAVDPDNYCASGGGGGSSGFGAGTSNTSVVLDTSGIPSITITYTLPSPPPDGGGGSGDGGGTSTPPPSGDGGGGTTTPPAVLALGEVAVPKVQHGFAVTGAANIGVAGSIFRADLYGDSPKFRKAPKIAKRVRLGHLLKAPVKAGLLSFTVKLSRKGRAALKKRKKLKLTLKITVTPPSGQPMTVKRVVTLKRR